jgi:hypothetical protein
MRGIGGLNAGYDELVVKDRMNLSYCSSKLSFFSKNCKVKHG